MATKKIKHINKASKKRILQCVCGRFVSTRKSPFAKYDIVYGLFLLTIVVVALLIKAPVALALIVLPVVGIPWLVFFLAWIMKGHSSKCAARWASIVVLGSLGGYWL